MVSIGPKIQITGESAYRQALNRIISETKELNSEMDLMVAKFTKYDTAIDKNKEKQAMLLRQIEQGEKEFNKFKEGLSLATKKHEEANKAYEDNQKALQKLREEEQHTATVIKKLTDEFGEGNKYVEAAKKHYDALGNEIKETEEESDRLSKEVDRSGKVMADWQTKVNQAEKSVYDLRHALAEVPNQLDVIGGKLEEVGGMISGVGDTLTKYVTTPLVTAGGAFVKWSSDFTDGLAKVYTIAEESEKPMAEMRQELTNLSNQSGFSLEDLAEAEYQAVSASVATADSIKFLEQATKLARAGFTSTTKSVDILSTVMNSYGKETYDVAYISDILLKLQNDGKIVVDQMAEGMGTIIPLASAYNVGLEDLAAALATMTKQGVPASKAMTFLRAAFTELEKANSGVNKTLVKLTGHTFAQLMDSGMNLADVLGILYDHVKGDDEQFARLFGNVRSSQATISLATGGFSILRDEIEKMGHATGQTNYALEMLETPSLKAKRAIQQLKNSGMELGTALINELYPYFIKVIDGIKKATEWFSSLDDSTKTSIVNFGLMAAAAGPALKILGGGITTVGKFVKGIGSFSHNLLELSIKLESVSPALGNFVLQAGLALPTVVGVSAAFVGLAVATESAMEKQREEIAAIWGLDEQMKTHIDTSKQMEMSYVENKNAILDEMNATISQTEIAQALIDKYNNLIDANGQVRAGHEEMANIYLNQLAQTLGMELADVQALVEENGKFGESIQNTIDAIIRRAEAAAYEQILTDAIMRQTQAEMELEQQENDLVVQQARVKQAQEATKQAYEAMIDAQKRGDPEIGRYEQAWRDAVQAESEATAAEGQLRDSIDLTRTRVTAAEQDAQNARRKIKETAEGTMTDTTNAIKSGGDRVVTEAGNLSSRAESALSVDGYSPGYNASSGLAKGIRDASWMVEQEAARVSNLASAAMARALRERSPSRVTADIGRYFSEGFAIGIEDSTYKAISAANMLAQSAVGGVRMVGYEPPTTNYSKTVSAPISINLTIEGNVDGDDRAFAQNVADSLVNLINRKSEVFA